MNLLQRVIRLEKVIVDLLRRLARAEDEIQRLRQRIQELAAR